MCSIYQSWLCNYIYQSTFTNNVGHSKHAVEAIIMLLTCENCANLARENIMQKRCIRIKLSMYIICNTLLGWCQRHQHHRFVLFVSLSLSLSLSPSPTPPPQKIILGHPGVVLQSLRPIGYSVKSLWPNISSQSMLIYHLKLKSAVSRTPLLGLQN